MIRRVFSLGKFSVSAFDASFFSFSSSSFTMFQLKSEFTVPQTSFNDVLQGFLMELAIYVSMFILAIYAFFLVIKPNGIVIKTRDKVHFYGKRCQVLAQRDGVYILGHNKVKISCTEDQIQLAPDFKKTGCFWNAIRFWTCRR